MKRRANWKSEQKALEEVIERDQFLAEWLATSEAGRVEFERETAGIDAAARRRLALRAGFRSWREMLDCQDHVHRTLKQFVEQDYFQELWKKLRATDGRHGFLKLYGPHNGGVPMTLIRSIETWYQAPKFTAAGLAKHNRKIVSACDKLRTLLEQVTPGHFGDKFAALHTSELEAETIFDRFESPKRRRNMWGANSVRLAASGLLQGSGVTPLWAVQNIKVSALSEAKDVLPTKVAASTAFRTFITKELCKSLAGCVGHDSLPVSDQLIADVVSLLAYMDCSADDVRKTMMYRRKLERRTRLEGLEDSAP